MLKINNTLDGFLKDVEIKGNTIQDAENLADIRSVGDKVEGQELYEIPIVSSGKNIYKHTRETQKVNGVTYTFNDDGTIQASGTAVNYSGYLEIWRLSETNLPEGTYTFSGATGVNHNGTYYNCPVTKTIAQGDSLRLYITTNPGSSNNHLYKPQIEEGTVSTEYEPYQEHKLTILSSVQLEKVGDVADRIICKDGVWGVEKNIKTVVLNGSENWIIQEGTTLFETSKQYQASNKLDVVTNKSNGSKPNIISSFTTQTPDDLWNLNVIGITVNINQYILLRSNKLTINEFTNWLSDNNVTLKYLTTQPQFIPLPHDQQVKLRTFARQTNIHFETEIEGTLKAQVPKSLGATVNTHTEQIGNLSKELDRVKKLEESTVSTVTTESDFTTVEETSNGYFEDVKLEGKTLVNLAQKANLGYGSDSINPQVSLGSSYNGAIASIEGGKTYTVIRTNKSVRFLVAEHSEEIINGTIGKSLYGDFTDATNGNLCIKVLTSTDAKFIGVYLDNTGDKTCNVIILEGDHTQNPPEYFEGLMSVGQDVNEIIVESVDGDGNLFDGEVEKGNLLGSDGQEITHSAMYRSKFIPIQKKTLIIRNFSNKLSVEKYVLYDANFKFILNKGFCTFEDIIIPYVENSKYIRVVFRDYEATTNQIDLNDIKFSISHSNGVQNKLYLPYQSDKKPLLYYNNETQTWEKPVLREWDSIEKHADGKYYYHKRSGEVVLNGSESWEIGNGLGDTFIRFYTQSNLQNVAGATNGQQDVTIELCDKFTNKSFESVPTSEFITVWKNAGASRCDISISKSKLSTQDVQGFKSWLQANPTTVVYQLAEEEVYECTNIDLITYANETNFIVESGAIAPKSTLKVHNNISNVVKILQEKVSLLESNVKASQEVQDMMILESDMRILDIELALMEYMPITLNLGENTMLRSATYFNFIKGHIVNETYSKEYLENVMNKYLATNRLTQEEYDELYKLLYPPVYDIELPIEY